MSIDRFPQMGTLPLIDLGITETHKKVEPKFCTQLELLFECLMPNELSNISTKKKSNHLLSYS